jgi:hypothetical protein
MSRLLAPPESSYPRKVLFAAEVVDAVTLARISSGLQLRASGMSARPIVNWSGVFVWLDDGKPVPPQQIAVDPGLLPYAGVTVDAPAMPQRLVQIALSPARGYAFPAGATALRFSLIESDLGAPVPAAGAQVWLRWVGPGDSGTTWSEAPVRSRTDAGGDATVILRFAPGQEPGKDADGKLRVQLWASYKGITRRADEFSLAEGRVTDRSAFIDRIVVYQPFIWKNFKP